MFSDCGGGEEPNISEDAAWQKRTGTSASRIASRIRTVPVAVTSKVYSGIWNET